MIRDLKDCRTFTSGDGCILRELLHPEKMKADFRYSLAHAVLKRGQRSKPHKLTVSEVYYIIKGSGIMNIGRTRKKVKAGQAICIPPGKMQYIKNSGRNDLSFLCIVDPAWRSEYEKIY